VGTLGDHDVGVPGDHIVDDPVRIERLVGDETADGKTFEQRSDAERIVALAGQALEADRIARGVGRRDDLGGPSAARGADGLIVSPPSAPCPWRRTEPIVPSTKAYSMSESSGTAWNIAAKTPPFVHARKRSKTAFKWPNATGRSRH